eukprot:jgi/Chrzof1/7359/Cz02g20270.t1
MPDCVGVLKYGLYSVRPALPESRSFQMVLEAPRCFQMFLDVSKCVQKFLEPESHRGPTLKHRPQHRAEDTESLERLRQQISISPNLPQHRAEDTESLERLRQQISITARISITHNRADKIGEKEEQHKDTLDKVRSLQYRVKYQIWDIGFTGNYTQRHDGSGQRPRGLRPAGALTPVIRGASLLHALRASYLLIDSFTQRILLQSYHHESTPSHQNSEVKRGWARLVLG